MNRPNRQLRRQKGGKSDSVDAEGAARAAASGEATAVPKSGDGPVECLRMLLVARRSATKARTQAANQIHSVIVGAPEPVKHQLNLNPPIHVPKTNPDQGDLRDPPLTGSCSSSQDRTILTNSYRRRSGGIFHHISMSAARSPSVDSG